MMTNHITTFRKAFKIDKTLNLSETAPLIEAIYDTQGEAYAVPLEATSQREALPDNCRPSEAGKHASLSLH